MKRDYTTRTTCRCCSSPRLTEVVNLGDQFVSDFVDRDEVKTGNVVPIVLDRCADCTLVQARHAAPAEILYKGTYWYRSGITQTMRDALKDVAGYVTRVTDLKPCDRVLDIGSNDGTLLRSYPVKGLNLVGVEPAKNLVEEGRKGVDVLVNDLWSVEALDSWGIGPTNGVKYKAITAIGMFYDMEDPNPFVRDVSLALADDGVFVCQLMCWKQTLENVDVGNLAHEHLEFYTYQSLVTLMSKYGLYPFDVQENWINGGSYRVAFCKKLSDDRVPVWVDETGLLDADEFAANVEHSKRRTRDFLLQERAAGKRIWVYGASTKGNVILQYFGLDSSVVDGAADRDPNKWGKYTVGSGIKITSEEHARAANPDYFLVLPYAFLDEFVEREKNQEWRRRGGKFVVPFPEFCVV